MSAIEFLTHATGKAAGPPLSPAFRVGDYVYVSGQVPYDENGALVGFEVESQTRQVMRNIEACLKLAGCTLGDVFKSTVWLADARDFGRFNKVYAEFFKEGYPVRSTTEAKLMGTFLVEIEVAAYKPL